MHQISKTADKAQMTSRPPFGPGFSAQDAEAGDSMEVWGSSYSDPGADYCEFRLLKDGVILRTVRVAGY